jgi:hypothetical protein
MSNDPVQDRKEAKPVKVFTINAIVFDDGIMGGTCIEYRDLGRLKAQKCIVPGYDDFIASVRSIVPSTVPAIEPLAQQIFDDVEVTDTEHCEKIGRIVVDIYNDGFIDTDFGEVVKGTRGAPKTWRQEPRDFFDMVESRVGQLTTPLTPLIENRGSTLVDTSATSEALIDEATDLEDELQEDASDDKLQEDIS